MTNKLSELEIKLIETCMDFIIDNKDSFIEKYNLNPHFVNILPLKIEKAIKNPYTKVKIEVCDGLWSVCALYSAELILNQAQNKILITEKSINIKRNEYEQNVTLLQDYLIDKMPESKSLF